MAQKTVVIWDECGQSILLFFVTEKPVTHLDGFYISSDDITEKQQDEITALVYDVKTGAYIVEMTTKFPVNAVKDGAPVIILGIRP